MKKLFYLSVAFNALTVLFFVGKRLYFSYGSGAGPINVNNAFNTWDQMRNSLFKELPIDSTNIVFVGNSLTEGFPVTEIFGSHVKNRGISGNTTSNVLNRIESIAKKRPKKIFIEIGVNDFVFGNSVDSTFKNYCQILKNINDNSPISEIYVQSLMPTCMAYSKIIGNIKDLNNQLIKYCQSYNIRYVNLFSPMLKGEFLDSTLTSDGIHLNAKGYAIWERQIKEFVN